MGTEIARHLRTIHFSLVLACILILISLFVSSPGKVKTAHNQLQKIIHIKTNWKTWTQGFSREQITWLKQHGLAWSNTVRSEFYILPEALKKENLPDSDRGWKVRPLYSPIYFSLSVQRPNSGTHSEVIGFGLIEGDTLRIIPGGGSSELFGPTRLNTLEDFRHFWDGANYVQTFIVTKFFDVAYLISDDKKTELRLNSGLIPPTGTEVRVGHRGHAGELSRKCPHTMINDFFASQGRTEFNEYFCGVARQEGDFLFVPAMGKFVELPTNLRIWLAEEFNFPTVGGKFEGTFPELNEITKHYQKLELNDAYQILGAELQRTGERIEFLGLRFPESFISTWGAVILFIIQLYFWLHLRTFYEYLASSESSIDVAWIGIYSDPISRFISLLSVSLLPVVIVGYLVFWGDWFSWNGWFSWIFIPLFMILELLLAADSSRMMMSHNTSNHIINLLYGWIKRNVSLLKLWMMSSRHKKRPPGFS